jgi:hypothetical protein
MRQGQQRRCNAGNNDSSTMLVMTPAQCRQNASATLANASAVPAGPSKANLATMPAQRRQWGQLDAGNDASAMWVRTPMQCQKNAIAALARPSKAKLLWADAGYSNKATGDGVERNNDASPATCHDCIMIGWVPVCDAGGNAGVLRAATPAQQGQRRPHDKGNNAGAMPATTMARCWQWRQRVSQLRRDWEDASLRCWQQCKDNKGNNVSATRAKAPMQQGQWRQRNAGNKDDSTVLAMMPAQCGQNASAMPANASAAPAGPSKANSATTPVQRQQQGQLDTGNDASAMRASTPAQCQKNAIAALARPSKAEIAAGRRRVQQWGHGKWHWAQQRRLTNNGLQLRHDWADASVWCCRQRGCAKGGNASATRAKTPARRGQQCRRNVSNNNGAMLAILQQQWRNAGNDASACCNCVVTGKMPVCNAGSNAKVTKATMPARQGQKRPCNKGNDAGAMPATRTTAQCWQWCQRNAGKMPAQRWQTPARHQPDLRRPTWQQRRRNASNKDSLTLAMTPVQCGQGHQRNAKKTPLLPWPDRQRLKLLWADSRYSNKATGDNVERNNDASPTTGRNCIMTGQMPVYDAGGNAGVPRAATPAHWGQRRPRNKGNNAGATSATTMARCWWWRQRVLQLRRDWADASSQCWRWRKGNKGKNASATRTQALTQQGQWFRHNAGNNDSAMLVMTPAQCG